MTNDTKRKLYLWGGGLVLVALFFGNSLRETVTRIMIMRQAPKPPATAPPPQVGLVPGSPSAQRAALRPPTLGKLPAQNGTPDPSGPDAPAPDTSLDRLIGVWEGFGPVPPNMCTLRIEIRRKEGDATRFAGFPTLTCVPMTMPKPTDPAAMQKILTRFAPMSAVLSGTAMNGSIPFDVDKALGKSADGCPITAVTVTPFGADQISVEWQAAPCFNGNLLLKKGKG